MRALHKEAEGDHQGGVSGSFGLKYWKRACNKRFRDEFREVGISCKDRIGSGTHQRYAMPVVSCQTVLNNICRFAWPGHCRLPNTHTIQ